MIPDNLDGWTLPVIESLLQQGVFESDRFDFKEMLPHAKDDVGKLRLAKTCAAFANSSGGFLVFGVKDDMGLTVSQRLAGLDPGEDLPGRFGSFPAIPEPSVAWNFRNPAIRLATGRLVHVVHIPASARRPHAIPDQGRWWFCKRTSKGTEAMSFEEVRDLFLDASRRRRELAWLRSKLEKILELQRTLSVESQDGRWTLDMLLSRFGPEPMEPVLLSLFDLINAQPSLVSDLNDLVDCCRKADAALANAASFAMMPRDRSFSESRLDPLDAIHEARLLIRIHNSAHRAHEAITKLRA
jgi:hypothetical protein